MRIFPHLLGNVQRAISRSAFCVALAIKVRNQMDCVIARYLGESPNPKLNGEALVMASVAPYCCKFVDVGANVGDWTRLFLSYCGTQCQGLLFEPGQQALGALHQKFDGLANIQIVDKAVGSKIDTLAFYEEQNAGEGSSLLEQVATKSASKRITNVTTLDFEIRQTGWDSIDYLKIDAEGYDYHVLLGATSLLKNKNIGIIQFEYNSHWAWANTTLAGAISLLKQYGYKCYLVRSNGLFEFNYAIYGEYLSYSNFVAIHREKAAWVDGLLRGTI